MPRYNYLKKRLKSLDIDQTYLGELLGRGTCYVSMAFNCKNDGWTAKEMYKIMEIINEPLENLYLVFPPNGMALRKEDETPRAEDEAAKKIIEAIRLMAGKENTYETSR